MCFTSINLYPVTTKIAAKLEIGIILNKLGTETTNSSSQTPCSMPASRVLAPAFTFTEPRTITPVIGKDPKAPHIILPIPWAANSRSKFVLFPECNRSTAAAESKLSALAMKAIAVACSSRGA